jgi:hypothetical protein
MYLFTRRARLIGGKLVEGMGWATTIAERVAEVSGMQVRVFTTAFGPEVGAMRWTAFVPDLQTLQDNMDALAADSGYRDLVEKGSEHVLPGSVDDSLHVILHGSPDPARVVKYVSSVRTTMVGGGFSRGVPLGIEIAQHAEKVTGLPSLFAVDATGNYGGVAWFTAFGDIAELERSQMALGSDAAFVEFLDSNVAGVYTLHPGATRQEIYRAIS